MKNLIKKRRKVIIILIVVGIIIVTPSLVLAYNLYSYNNLYLQGKNYLSNEKFDNAIAAFDSAASTYFGKKHIKEINNNIKLARELKTSKVNYEQGIKLYNEKKYTDAIDILKKVAKDDDKRYKDSTLKIEEAKKSYIAENINKAKNEANNTKYEQGISYLDEILNFDNNNEEAKKLKDEYNLAIQKAKEEKDLENKRNLEVQSQLEIKKKETNIATKKPSVEKSVVSNQPSTETKSVSNNSNSSHTDLGPDPRLKDEIKKINEEFEAKISEGFH